MIPSTHALALQLRSWPSVRPRKHPLPHYFPSPGAALPAKYGSITILLLRPVFPGSFCSVPHTPDLRLKMFVRRNFIPKPAKNTCSGILQALKGPLSVNRMVGHHRLSFPDPGSRCRAMPSPVLPFRWKPTSYPFPRFRLRWPHCSDPRPTQIFTPSGSPVRMLTARCDLSGQSTGRLYLRQHPYIDVKCLQKFFSLYRKYRLSHTPQKPASDSSL